MKEFNIGPWVREFPRESGNPVTGEGRDYAQDRAERDQYLGAFDLAMLLHYTGQPELAHGLVLAWHRYLDLVTHRRSTFSLPDPMVCLEERRRLAQAGLVLIAALAPDLLEGTDHGI